MHGLRKLQHMLLNLGSLAEETLGDFGCLHFTQLHAVSNEIH